MLMMDCSAKTVGIHTMHNFRKKRKRDKRDKRHGETLSDHEVCAGEQNVK